MLGGGWVLVPHATGACLGALGMLARCPLLFTGFAWFSVALVTLWGYLLGAPVTRGWGALGWAGTAVQW